MKNCIVYLKSIFVILILTSTLLSISSTFAGKHDKEPLIEEAPASTQEKKVDNKTPEKDKKSTLSQLCRTPSVVATRSTYRRAKSQLATLEAKLATANNDLDQLNAFTATSLLTTSETEQNLLQTNEAVTPPKNSLFVKGITLKNKKDQIDATYTQLLEKTEKLIEKQKEKIATLSQKIATSGEANKQPSANPPITFDDTAVKTTPREEQKSLDLDASLTNVPPVAETETPSTLGSIPCISGLKFRLDEKHMDFLSHGTDEEVKNTEFIVPGWTLFIPPNSSYTLATSKDDHLIVTSKKNDQALVFSTHIVIDDTDAQECSFRLNVHCKERSTCTLQCMVVDSDDCTQTSINTKDLAADHRDIKTKIFANSGDRVLVKLVLNFDEVKADQDATVALSSIEWFASDSPYASSWSVFSSANAASNAVKDLKIGYASMDVTINDGLLDIKPEGISFQKEDQNHLFLVNKETHLSTPLKNKSVTLVKIEDDRLLFSIPTEAAMQQIADSFIAYLKLPPQIEPAEHESHL